MTRRTPRSKQAHHAAQQRRIAAALNFWQAALIQIESKPGGAEGAPPAEISEKVLKSGVAPVGRPAHGIKERQESPLFWRAIPPTGGRNE